MPLLRTQSSTYRIEVIQYEESLFVMNITTTHGRTQLLCVSLAVDGALLLLQSLGYYKECSIGQTLRRGTGTVDMVKAALRFAAASFPDLQSVELSDETFFPSAERPLITARRLLLGAPGWYQEHLGAVPTPKTRVNLRTLQATLAARPDVEAELRGLAGQPQGFTPTYVSSVCRRLGIPASAVVGTSWTIPLGTVMSWEMPTVVHEEPEVDAQEGGGGAVEWPPIQCPICF